MLDQKVPENPLDGLTAKQREVLDLLIEHKTSKEISRLLNISPHTVDQRINLARSKLNLGNRGEVAQEYRRLVSVYEQPVYQSSHIDPIPVSDHLLQRVDTVGLREKPLLFPDSSLASGSMAGGMAGAAGQPANMPANMVVPGYPQTYYHVLPEMFDGPYGTMLRLGYIFAITVFLIMIVLGGLSMFAQLSAIVDL